MMKNLLIGCTASILCLVSCDNSDSSSGQAEAKLVTSSNTTGKVSYVDLLATNPTVNSLTIASADAEGVSYDSDTDVITVASRTNNRIEGYTGIKSGLMTLNLSTNSTAGDFTNARETAVFGDKIVVTQDELASNLLLNKFFVYQKTSTGFTLLKSFTPKFKLWGIHVQGNDLYAVVDLTGDIVMYKDFMSNASGDITPTKRVTIEGLTRTHGITYSSADDVMILTDVASAASATDGGLIFIKNFNSVFASTATAGKIAMSSQVRVYGPSSLLGNPVDVAYDHVTNKTYVAERLNAGGQVLVYNYPTASGDMAPANPRLEAGVTSIFLLRK